MQWTIKAALDWTCGHLERRGDERPRLSAQWLLCHATGLTRMELYTHFDQPLTMAERDTLRASIQRRTAGEPLQYITGEVTFRRIPLKVCPGVLIPRPETELLIELLEPIAINSRLLDICTGTGCIALSVAHEHPQTRVLATDISPEAIDLARQNAKALDLEKVEFTIDDLATALLQDQANHSAFDVVVSNPPYIPSGQMPALPAEVRDFEPALALDGGPDGLRVFDRLVSQAAALLKAGGLLACELHEQTCELAASKLPPSIWHDARVHADLTGRPRFITAKRNHH